MIMAILQHKHVGIVLAAGASSRMGQAKALLTTTSGKPLAFAQAGLLSSGGTADVIIVLGHDAENIATKLGDSPWPYCFNLQWNKGRLSSLQAGIRAMPTSTHGVIILPVDTVGVKLETIAIILAHADHSTAISVRPCYKKSAGQILWISNVLFNEILGLTPDPSFRFDSWIRSRATSLEVDDAAILNNVNTMEEWRMLEGF